jgi:hypothetical protein
MTWSPREDWIRYETGSPIDLAWAAGLFDGEGSTTYSRVHVTKQGEERRYVRLSMTNTDPDLLERFQMAVGCGTRHAAFRPSYKGAKMQYAWHTDSRTHAEHAIAVLWPYLSRPKREQAEHAFAVTWDVPFSRRKVK